MSAKDQLRAACSDSAQSCKTSLFTLVAACLYVAITASSITDLEFLTGTTVKLPVIGVSVPLLPAMYLAPAIVLAIHAYTLSHYLQLLRRLHRLRAVLHGKPEAGDLQFVASPFLPGQAALKHQGLGFLKRLSGIGAVSTIFALPLLTLILHQALHVRYQDDYLTAFHAAVVTMDVLLLYRAFRETRVLSEPGSPVRRCLPQQRVIVLLSIATLYLAWLDMIPPAGWLETRFSVGINFAGPTTKRHCEIWQQRNTKPTEYKDLVKSEGFLVKPTDNNNFNLRCRTVLLSGEKLIDKVYRRALVLTRTNIVPDLGSEDSIITGHDLIGRKVNRNNANLRLLTMIQVDMPRAYLYGADLQYAYFDKSNLNGSHFVDSDAKNAVFRKTSFRNANLSYGEFDNADFEKSVLIAAELTNAELIKTAMRKVDMRGANLTEAALRHTDMSRATLDFAILKEAKLEDANLEHVTLRAAELTGMKLNKLNDGSANVRLCETNFSAARMTSSAYKALRDVRYRLSSRCHSKLLPSVAAKTESSERYYTSRIFPLIFRAVCNTPGLAEAIYRRYSDPHRDAIELDMNRWYNFGVCPPGTRAESNTLAELMPKDLALEVEWVSRANSINHRKVLEYVNDAYPRAPDHRKEITFPENEKIEGQPPSLIP